MINRKHILIYILIAGSIFTLPACSNGTDTKVSASAASTRSSNFKAPDMPDDMDHEPPQGLTFDISNKDIFEKGYYAVQFNSFGGQRRLGFNTRGTVDLRSLQHKQRDCICPGRCGIPSLKFQGLCLTFRYMGFRTSPLS